ncbi:uroporphyrinogen-III C-methyltransferase [Metabacillus arenae]|uniref:Uroporphyrinogen-III C-methyltransferase n=1 Tax=Metabacillus arenae TaxID=2771434 RepID=A0A926NEE7_9BACI|nr:uroporphyrinogen-III C-methyltransferase [Metabacillus arenae]MBD1379974.1 uroporphyrinogen-III C-methyltransferase [Metabacillus arenae]
MGKVYLVGAGPGDSDLITVKGMKAIKKADVVLYDRLVNKDLLEYAKPDADLIYCGKLPNYHIMKQETIHHFLVKFAKAGKVVTRLKGGDPFVFGRGGEEAEYLVRHQIPFEVVPGVTSGVAAAAYAGIPVTHREVSGSVAFITGHKRKGTEEDIKWEALANGIDTLAIYMGMSNLSYILEKLILNGKSKQTPIAVVHWGTSEKQQTITGTLETIEQEVIKHRIGNPSMIVIGEVVKFHNQLSWFESKEEISKLAGEAL